MTAATIATTKKTPTTFRSISGVGSLCHPCITTTHLSYRCPILETSATALRGTAGTPDQELGLVPNVTLGHSIFEVVGSYTKGFISAGEPGDVF